MHRNKVYPRFLQLERSAQNELYYGPHSAEGFTRRNNSALFSVFELVSLCSFQFFFVPPLKLPQSALSSAVAGHNTIERCLVLDFTSIASKYRVYRGKQRNFGITTTKPLNHGKQHSSHKEKTFLPSSTHSIFV